MIESREYLNIILSAISFISALITIWQAWSTRKAVNEATKIYNNIINKCDIDKLNVLYKMQSNCIKILNNYCSHKSSEITLGIDNQKNVKKIIRICFNFKKI